ncbi:uncharacterized protein LOC127881422 [Dreissena polymorpha]|uniref:Uncharacterized protein n=1 Tax=Dreissena polymorpha TaxID=45954 RepID=A0A9D4K071_DREPO|nr:uncharacterized protein LOC127881422 [Dreissena polymorpha]KAH3829579.1 hypothetical protein DPMN_131576 [Dreissena polymorpha]
MLAGKIGLVILLGVAVTQVLTQNCDANAVMERYQSCTTIPIGISQTTTSAMINALCQNVECTIQCVADAVGTCYKTDAFFNYDPVMFKVASRLMCKQSQAMLDILQHCSKQMFIDNTCFTTFASSLLSAVGHFTSGNYASYKSAMCSATNAFVACLGNAPFGTSGTCTADMAAFATGAFVVSYSYSECGSAQTHQYFTTYAGDVTCGASRFAMTIAYAISALILVI